MIAILNYTAGNTASVCNALNRLGQPWLLSDDPAELRRADKLILPGVGAAGAAMADLKQRGLDTLLRTTQKPVLGICLGLQLLAESSEEGDTECLGIIPGRVVRFNTDLRIPQVGWNQMDAPNTKRPTPNYYYFINSYYLPPGPCTIATATYGVPFSAIVRKDNFLATQFHPEKSGEAGLRFLRRFCLNS